MTNALEEPPLEERFQFGENWSRFASDLSEKRIADARRSLEKNLGEGGIEGRSFLDIGSGSGLFSLSAAQLGAVKIHSLDFDPNSVATTKRLKESFAPDSDWTVERASALDRDHMSSLGQWDIVYSWGVLHHTGAMWEAMKNACDRVRPGGRLFISIYNDQGRTSKIWLRIKRLYNRLPRPLRVPYAIVVMAPLELRMLANETLALRPDRYFKAWLDRGEDGRGMSRWHDLLDWVGGYPFEVATPDEVFSFCTQRGFVLRELKTAGGGLGCNQFVFERTA